MPQILSEAEQRASQFNRTLERRAYEAVEREVEALRLVGQGSRVPQRTTPAGQAHVIDSAELHRPEQVQGLIEQVADTVAGLDIRDSARLGKYHS